MQIALEVVQGLHCGRRFTFDKHDNFIVGRARCAHFRLPQKDPYFSRVHFMIEVNPPRCRLVDMGSTNGTWVNGRRVQAIELREGDLIQGGNTVLKVSVAASEGASVSRPRTEPPLPPVGSSPPPTVAARTQACRLAPPELSAESGNIVAAQPSEFPSIEGYRLLRELGRGGMGMVYLAMRCHDRSQVALKTIQPVAAAAEREIERFLREANILRQLRHPHIVAFHEMGCAGDLLFFAMDYVPGSDTSKLLQREGPLAIDRGVRILCQALEALHYAHGQGFVHRDIKPANLLVCGQQGFETCKLADFGLARVYHASPLSGLTIMGDAGGTIPYMPPEQITHYRDVSPAADQYSAAATLYRILTGRYVFDFEDVPKERQLHKILLARPVSIRVRRPDVPVRLAEVIHRALENNPAARFSDAVAFRDALLPFGGDAEA